MKTKLFLLIAVLLAFAGIERGNAQEPLADTVWTKKMPGEVHDVKFSPDAEYIAAIAGSSVYILQSLDGEIIKQFDIQGGANNLDFSFTGDTLLASGNDNKMHFYDIRNLIEIKTINSEKMIYISRFIDDYTKVITTTILDSADIRSLIIYDINSGEAIEHKEVVGAIWHLIVSKDHKYFAFDRILHKYPDGLYGIIELWNAMTFTKIKTLGQHEDQTTDLAFSPDGSMLASSSWDQTVKIWDVEGKSLYKNILNNDYPYIKLLDFSNNSKQVFISFAGQINECGFYFWDILRDSIINSYKYNTVYCIDAMAVSSIDSSNIIGFTGPYLKFFNLKYYQTSIRENLLDNFTLLYPNPTNNLVNIEFTLTNNENVIIELLNLNGQLIEIITNDFFPTGLNKIQYDCSNLASGAYFVHIVKDGNFTISYKLIKR
jgi:WD40 repeat protein